MNWRASMPPVTLKHGDQIQVTMDVYLICLEGRLFTSGATAGSEVKVKRDGETEYTTLPGHQGTS